MSNCLVLAMIPYDATNSPEAMLDYLFKQAKASLLRGRDLRIETGKILYKIQTLCEQSGLRDYTKRVTEELGLPERTARDYRNEYLKSLTEATTGAANFAGGATVTEGASFEESSQEPEKETTSSEGGNASATTQQSESKQPRKAAEGFYVRFLYLSKGMDKKVKAATQTLGYERAAEILIAEAAKLTPAPVAA
jgi:hypothetical protein